MANSSLQKILRPIQIRKLVQDVAKQITESGFNPTRIVCIANDGKIVAELLNVHFGLPVDTIAVRRRLSKTMFLLRSLPIKNDRISAQIQRLRQGVRRNTSPVLRSPFKGSINPTERILLVDDSVTTGKTLEVAQSHLQEVGFKASQIKTAVLWLRPSFRGNKPNYYASISETPIPWDGRAVQIRRLRKREAARLLRKRKKRRILK